jgi:serine/threonine-protein kinase HipA
MILAKDKEDTALLLGGKKENFNRGYFDRLGFVLQLNDKQITAVYRRLKKWLPNAIQLVDVSFLKDERKSEYAKLITDRTNLFIA